MITIVLLMPITTKHIHNIDHKLHSSTNIKSSEIIWPESIDEIQKLEYYHSFIPNKNGYDSFNSTYEFEGKNGNNLLYTMKHTDLTKVTESSDLQFNLSAITQKVNNVNNSFLNYAYSSKKGNIFYNLSNIENDQMFIVDTMILYPDYFKTSKHNGYFELYLSFEYQGEVSYSYLLEQAIDTYHYQSNDYYEQNCG